MSNYINTNAVVGVTAACSFILLGNAITQSFMGVPALLVDFPLPISGSGSTSSAEYTAACKKLGKQWPIFWSMGNVFFRPMSTLGIFTYSYAAIATLRAASSLNSSSSSYSSQLMLGGGGGGSSDVVGLLSTTWKLYAISAACHLVTVIHSAVNMQPINERIDKLRGDRPPQQHQQQQQNGKANGNGKAEEIRVASESAHEGGLAEYWVRRWIRLNTVRIVMPAVAGSLAMWGLVRGTSR